MRSQSITPPEEWRPVVGYEGLYEVSDLGNIRRIGNSIRHPARPNRPLRGGEGSGYLTVYLCGHGKPQARAIHRLVAEAFLGPCPTGHEVNHKNGAKPDNRAVNLEWITSSQNHHHAYAAGLTTVPVLRGEANPRAKLTIADVQIIRSRRGVMSQRRLAQQFGVTHAAIEAIQAGRTWKGT